MHYEFPNKGHGVMRSDECALRIGLQFLDDPWTEPGARIFGSVEA